MNAAVNRLRANMAKLAKAGGVQAGRRPAGGGQGGGAGSGIIGQIFMPKLMKALPFDLRKLSGGVGFFGAAAAGLSTYLAIVGKNWYEWYEMIQSTRKELGLTSPETDKFGADVLSMTAKYGVAMDRVGNIARFVGQGTDIARGGVVKLAGALANISDASGASEESVKRFGFMLNRTLGMSTDMTEKVSTGVLAIARSSHVSMEDLQGDLLSARDALFIASKDIGGPEATKSFAALAAGMREAGAESQDVRAVMAKLQDRSSKLFSVFAGSGYDLNVLKGYLKTVKEEIDANSLSAAASGDIWDKLGSVALSKLAESAADTGVNLEEFTEKFNMSPEQRKAFVESTLNPIDKLKRVWNGFMADQVKGLASILEGWENWHGSAGMLLEDFRDMTKVIGQFIFQMRDWNAEADKAYKADKNVALINEHAKQLQKESETKQKKFLSAHPFSSKLAPRILSNVEANALARQHLLDFSAVQNVPPAAETAAGAADPTVELHKRELVLLGKLKDEFANVATQAFLRGARYFGAGGGGSNGSQSTNPMVDAQRGAR